MKKKFTQCVNTNYVREQDAQAKLLNPSSTVPLSGTEFSSLTFHSFHFMVRN